MRCAALLAAEVGVLPDLPNRAVVAAGASMSGSDVGGVSESTAQALAQLEHCAKELGAFRREHRSATLSSVASGALTAEEAIARVDAVRRLEALAHHAWRSAAHLVGLGA
jgi:phosphate:Na+ symporter